MVRTFGPNRDSMVLRMMAGPSGRECGADNTSNRVSVEMRIF
jgi:hypothetical protein